MWQAFGLAKVLLVSFCLWSSSVGAQTDSQQAFDRLLASHQKMILLLAEATELDPLDRHVHSARNFYDQSHHEFYHLIQRAESEMVLTSKRRLLSVTLEFIDYYQNNQALQRADRLAFADLAEELLLLEQERQVPAQGLIQLREINADIQSVSDFFREQYRKTLSKLGKSRGANEDWQHYLDYLRQRYDDQSLLQEVEAAPRLSREKTRGANLARDKKDQLAGQLPKVVWGNGLPKKTVVLTFDDGPHRLRTAKILDTLKTYEVKGYFFAVGKNLGSVTTDANGQSRATLNKRNLKVIDRILDEGHILANHSFSHAELTKLETERQIAELYKTNELIKASTGFENRLFRPPYGSKNKALESIVAEQSMASIMWNVDSMDWADPIPESIAQRTLELLNKKQRGVLLFHDIHKQTVAALPLILEGLAEQGYRVTTLDGSPFTLGDEGVPKLPQAKKPELYKNSWAVVIGVNEYQHWPKLDYAVNDARSIADKLQQEFGFAKDHIIELYDDDASRDNIAEVLGYTLADPKKVGKDDRVFIFYAGHGATRPLPSGKSLGYLIPVDADLERYPVQGISMSQLSDFSAMIPAKHVYFVMDSCYSGLALTRSGGGAQAFNYLEHITDRHARQILTAGGADQEVADGGPNGHSVFTWALLQALDGKADTDNNGYLTASEIGTYVSPVVASYAPQTPAFGNLIGNQGGDFVFELGADSSARKQQLAAQEKARQVAALTAKQDDLSSEIGRQLELQKSRSDTASSVGAPSTGNPDTALKNNQRVRAAYQLDAEALTLLRAGKLLEAEKKWAQAVKLNPYNENIVNNYGFVLDKLGRNDEALIWYYRTVELAPRRTPIYLNLGDMMVKLDKPELAIAYYQRYLHLYPSYKKAKQLQAKIKALAEG
ncbi:polysaccharide deacetylase family protein [Aestuariirhabdus sp. Z084]|uniref:polysaccharide deacetylase family protein n=1 Tax=Aestuariirhabdus haliotis TaxID=2918751 RepID=UPI00201B3E3F|nr:polysaccharide deacetylase family protein [Aestuariirhabdus haliotis]MCL6415098.1 polysaccharide deacetylase family protein [Aestuariirhabdus haliotis]MCL6419030.1 polysaccharide deacetylase family protein [Aestuariirhabdus haliotis]